MLLPQDAVRDLRLPALPQLGPVKYHLACEAAPFGGQLPRETAKVRGAGASSRARGADISYLTDGGGPRRAKARHPPSEATQGGPSADGRVPQQSEMPRAASLPPSLIPGPFHLMIESPFPLSHVSSFGELNDALSNAYESAMGDHRRLRQQPVLHAMARVLLLLLLSLGHRLEE